MFLTNVFKTGSQKKSRLNSFSFRPCRRSNLAQKPPVNDLPWGRDAVLHSYKTADKLESETSKSTGRRRLETSHCVCVTSSLQSWPIFCCLTTNHHLNCWTSLGWDFKEGIKTETLSPPLERKWRHPYTELPIRQLFGVEWPRYLTANNVVTMSSAHTEMRHPENDLLLSVSVCLCLAFTSVPLSDLFVRSCSTTSQKA
jgi:hypothetical protein